MPNEAGLYTKEERDADIQNALRERAKNHGATVEDLKAQLAEMTTRAAANEKAAKEVEGLRGELSAAQDTATLMGAGIMDAKAAKRLRQAYAADVEGLKGADRPTLADWLRGDGAEDVARYAPAAKTDVPAVKVEPEKTGAQVVTRSISTSAGAVAAAGAAKMTPEIYATRTNELIAKRGAAPRDQRAEIDKQIDALRSEFRGQQAG